jgi:hypothetical protein
MQVQPLAVATHRLFLVATGMTGFAGEAKKGKLPCLDLLLYNNRVD